MKSYPKVLGVFLGLIVIVLSGATHSIAAETLQNQVESHLLDGRIYAGQNGSKGMPSDHDDELIFANGQFRSTSCDPYGFGAGTYKTTAIDGIITFEAITQSPSHGQIVWRGTVTGDTLDATSVWTKERWYWDIRKEYWFKGRLKQ
jgi:hypothetical protein